MLGGARSGRDGVRHVARRLALPVWAFRHDSHEQVLERNHPDALHAFAQALTGEAPTGRRVE